MLNLAFFLDVEMWKRETVGSEWKNWVLEKRGTVVLEKTDFWSFSELDNHSSESWERERTKTDSSWQDSEPDTWCRMMWIGLWQLIILMIFNKFLSSLSKLLKIFSQINRVHDMPDYLDKNVTNYSKLWIKKVTHLVKNAQIMAFELSSMFYKVPFFLSIFISVLIVYRKRGQIVKYRRHL